MSNYKKLFAMFILCAAAFVSHPTKSQAADTVTFVPTYDQCMSWCPYDFFTCDGYCSRYSDAE